MQGNSQKPTEMVATKAEAEGALQTLITILSNNFESDTEMHSKPSACHKTQKSNMET